MKSDEKAFRIVPGNDFSLLDRMEMIWMLIKRLNLSEEDLREMDFADFMKKVDVEWIVSMFGLSSKSFQELEKQTEREKSVAKMNQTEEIKEIDGIPIELLLQPVEELPFPEKIQKLFAAGLRSRYFTEAKRVFVSNVAELILMTANQLSKNAGFSSSIVKTVKDVLEENDLCLGCSVCRGMKIVRYLNRYVREGKSDLDFNRLLNNNNVVARIDTGYLTLKLIDLPFRGRVASFVECLPYREVSVGRNKVNRVVEYLGDLITVKRDCWINTRNFGPKSYALMEQEIAEVGIPLEVIGKDAEEIELYMARYRKFLKSGEL